MQDIEIKKKKIDAVNKELKDTIFELIFYGKDNEGYYLILHEKNKDIKFWVHAEDKKSCKFSYDFNEHTSTISCKDLSKTMNIIWKEIYEK